jgi:hypothetical protein
LRGARHAVAGQAALSRAPDSRPPAGREATAPDGPFAR